MTALRGSLASRERTGYHSTASVNRYLTHDNGSRPFEVCVFDDGKNVNVVQQETKTNCWDRRVYRVFIGKDGGKTELDGNTILLEEGGRHIVFVGGEMFKFRPFACIRDFFSPIGNNDVPYPYAIDIDKRYYLLIEKVCIENVPDVFQNRPYDWYYRRGLITDDRGWIPHVKPLVDTRGIRNFFIDGEGYTLSYTPSPKEEYLRMERSFGGRMEVEYLDGGRDILNLNSFVQLIEEFGENATFKILNHFTFIS
jgi:hypothetical protein